MVDGGNQDMAMSRCYHQVKTPRGNPFQTEGNPAFPVRQVLNKGAGIGRLAEVDHG